jgi:hypothetical protein
MINEGQELLTGAADFGLKCSGGCVARIGWWVGWC